METSYLEVIQRQMQKVFARMIRFDGLEVLGDGYLTVCINRVSLRDANLERQQSIRPTI